MCRLEHTCTMLITGYGMQREAGVIRMALPDGVAESFSYDYDRSIILNDWYHKSTYEQAAGLSSIPFVWVGDHQVLIKYEIGVIWVLLYLKRVKSNNITKKRMGQTG